MFSPKGYSSFNTNLGIKDHTLDFGVIFSEEPANFAALFTKNNVKGNPILYGQQLVKKASVLRGLIVNSKNSNVATGQEGYEDCKQLCRTIEKEMGVSKNMVFPSSTGVIGRRLPIDKMITGVKGCAKKFNQPADFTNFAKAIMTTDTFHKIVTMQVGQATLIGVAKGSGMIEPNMATMLCYFFTDASFSNRQLKKMLQKSSDMTFNSLSVDSDMSTSDTALIMANGMAGKVSKKEFSKALIDCSTNLTKMLARDGEGATKLFIVDVINAYSTKDARLAGKAIINSPLVKTAIYKGDPNWGRIFMAAGKSSAKFDPKKIEIYWGSKQEIRVSESLGMLSSYLESNEELYLTVNLNNGKKNWRVYGCDLTEEYVKINAYYTT
jgi:glutamate N-acetyltransferase / amino-acid N-acetyltransferase